MAHRKIGERLAELENYEAALKVGFQSSGQGGVSAGGEEGLRLLAPPAPTPAPGAGPVPLG